MAISQSLRLDGDSLISICINRGSIEESEKYFKALTDKLTEQIWPSLTAHLVKIGAMEKVNACDTIIGLENLRFSVTPDDMAKTIAAELDKLEELTDTERYFAFFRLFDILMGGSFNYVQQLLQQRAAVIQMKKKRSPIITP